MNRLLMVFLRGGADGLSLLVPPDPEYRTARRTLGIPENQLLDVGDGWGMHPSLPRLHQRLRAGSASIAPAVGLPEGDRSHFSVQHRVEIGGRSAAALQSGWLGRHLQATAGGAPKPMRAVSLGTVSLPATFRGSDESVAAASLDLLQLGVVPRPRNGRAAGGPLSGRFDLSVDWFSDSWKSSPGAFADGVSMGIGIQGALGSLKANETTLEDAGQGYGTAAAFAEATRLFDSDIGTEIVMMNLDGWDTHDQQGTGKDGTLGGLLSALDAGLGTFLDHHANDTDPVTALVVTEFGRRVQENSSGGTDHGKGGVAFVAGAGAAGGIRGDWPGLAQLDDGDVAPVTDTTWVLAEVAQKVLKTPDLEKVIPGADPSKFIGMCA